MFLILEVLAGGRGYYISSANGDDSRTVIEAGSPETPWKSLARLDSVLLFPGDSVLLRRGETFTGTFRPRQKADVDWRPGVFVGAYGSGSRPVIDGTVRIEGWSSDPERPGVWIAQGPKGVVGAKLLVDGKAATTARLPAKGWYQMMQPEADRSFAAPDLPSRDWSGAWVHLKSTAWNIDGRRIARFEGGRIHLHQPAFRTLNEGWGYFIAGVPAALSGPGQWAHDSSTGKIHWWPKSGQDPSRSRVQLAVTPCGLDFRGGKKDVLVRDLSFFGQAEAGICGEGANRIRISHVDVVESDQSGIRLYGRENEISDSRVERSTTSGIVVLGSQTKVVRDTVLRVGDLEAIGPRGFGDECCGGRGIQVRGDSSLVSNNLVRWTGWTGIWFAGKGMDILDNLVDSAVQTSNDGGGLYTFSMTYADSIGVRNRIHGNVIRDVLGNVQGAKHGRQGEGIYLDLALQGMSIRRNVVSGCARGVLFHDNRQDTLVGNLFYLNDQAVKVYRDSTIRDEMFGNRVDSNVIVLGQGQQAFSIDLLIPNPAAPIDTNGNLVCVDGLLELECFRDGGRIWGSPRQGIQSALAGPDLFKIGSFGVRGWQGWPESVILDALPGGTDTSFGFQVSYRPASGQTSNGLVVHVEGSPVDSGSWHLLRFKAKAARPGMRTELAMLEAGGSYSPLSERKFVDLDTSWKDHQIWFKTRKAASSARIDFSLRPKDSLLWLDGISWRRLDTAEVPRQQRTRLMVAPPWRRTPGESFDLGSGIWRTPLGNIVTRSGATPEIGWMVVLKDTGVPQVRPPQVQKWMLNTTSAVRVGSGWKFQIESGAKGAAEIVIRMPDGRLQERIHVPLDPAGKGSAFYRPSRRGLFMVEYRTPDGNRTTRSIVWQ